MLRERVPVSPEDAAKLFAAIEKEVKDSSSPAGSASHGRRLGADFCSGKSLDSGNTEGSGTVSTSGGSIDFYYSFPMPGGSCGSNPSTCLDDDACIEFTTNLDGT